MGSPEFRDPWFLLLLGPWVLWSVIFFWRRLGLREYAIGISSRRLITGRRGLRAVCYPWLPVLRLLAMLLLIIALARPGRGIDHSSIKNNGIDIMVVLDVSRSMAAEDFQPKNRLHVARDVLRDFVSRRKTDRLGMVIFAGEAYLQCPLTADRNIVSELVDEVDFDSVAVDGTAIGDALALAAARLDESKARSRVILLLTDGMNNRGTVEPDTAAEICAARGIKIYSVGIGRDGEVPMPTGGLIFRTTTVINHFDEAAIRTLSEKTGGTFFRATSAGVLREHIDEIDRLEKSSYDVRVYHEFSDGFAGWLAAAFVLFALEILLRALVFRKVP